MKHTKHTKSSGNILCLRHTKHKKHTKRLICLTHKKHMKHTKLSGNILMPETHEAYEAQEAHEAYEAHAPKADGAYRAADTQGKRGKKALRMTMAFSEENMDYIRTMGKLESGGATAYVNRLIEADRRKHADVYRQMKTLRPDA